MKLPNLERLRENLRYDPETGLLWWLLPNKGRQLHRPAGTFSDGYIIIKFEGIVYKAHNLAWFITYGEAPKKELDHLDRRGFNNKLVNLADKTRSANNLNQNLSSRNSSGFRGVSWDKRRGQWHSRISIEKKDIHLGRFYSFEDAVEARLAAEAEYGVSST